jgi:hypothetical protein
MVAGPEIMSTLSEGSSAEKADLHLDAYLPVRTIGKLSNEQENLEGNELKYAPGCPCVIYATDL